MYVAMTRGRVANHVYLAVVGDGDPHSVTTPAVIRPSTATDILTAVPGRDEAQQSATSAASDLANPATRLTEATRPLPGRASTAADGERGPGGLRFLDVVGEHVHPGLTDSPAWPTLRSRLALIAADGGRSLRALRAAADQREFGSADDPASVLDWRLNPADSPSISGGPLPWLPAIPPALAAAHPTWGAHLTTRAQLISDCAEQVRTQAAVMTPLTAPAWTTALLDAEHAGLRVELAVWRAATGTAADDLRPTGPVQPAAPDRRHQLTLDRAAQAATEHRELALARWAALTGIDPLTPTAESLQQPLARLAHSIDHCLPAEDVWPQLAAAMTLAVEAQARPGAGHLLDNATLNW